MVTDTYTFRPSSEATVSADSTGKEGITKFSDFDNNRPGIVLIG